MKDSAKDHGLTKWKEHLVADVSVSVTACIPHCTSAMFTLQSGLTSGTADLCATCFDGDVRSGQKSSALRRVRVSIRSVKCVPTTVHRS